MTDSEWSLLAHKMAECRLYSSHYINCFFISINVRDTWDNWSYFLLSRMYNWAYHLETPWVQLHLSLMYLRCATNSISSRYLGATAHISIISPRRYPVPQNYLMGLDGPGPSHKRWRIGFVWGLEFVWPNLLLCFRLFPAMAGKEKGRRGIFSPSDQ